MTDEASQTPESMTEHRPVEALIAARDAIDVAIEHTFAALPEEERALLGDDVSGFGLPVIKSPVGGIGGGLLGTATPQFGRLGSRTGLVSDTVQNTSCNSGCGGGPKPGGSGSTIL